MAATSARSAPIPGQLEQVIVNLAVNARDAMLAKDERRRHAHPPDHSRRRRRRAPDGQRDPADRRLYRAQGLRHRHRHPAAPSSRKIFEPFFTTKEVGKGTGLGLSTVYGIVKQSGGFIFAEIASRARGRSFTIYLPVHRAEAGEAGRARRRKEQAGELWGTGTILLVEDEAMVRAVAERALTRHGYTVLIAENGEAALEILDREKRGRPDDLATWSCRPWTARPPRARPAQDAARPADPVHLRLCRGAAAQVDRPRAGRLPRQALLGPAAGRGGEGRLAC